MKRLSYVEDARCLEVNDKLCVWDVALNTFLNHKLALVFVLL